MCAARVPIEPTGRAHVTTRQPNCTVLPESASSKRKTLAAGRSSADLDVSLGHAAAEVDGDHRERFLRSPAIRHNVLPRVVTRGSYFEYVPAALVKHGLRGELEHSRIQLANVNTDWFVRPARELYRRPDAAPF